MYVEFLYLIFRRQTTYMVPSGLPTHFSFQYYLGMLSSHSNEYFIEVTSASKVNTSGFSNYKPHKMRVESSVEKPYASSPMLHGSLIYVVVTISNWCNTGRVR